VGSPPNVIDVQRYLRAMAADGRQCMCTGPFDVFIDTDSDHPYANYAIPRDGAEPTLEQAYEVVAVMQGAARQPRLEYLPAIAPKAEAVLCEAGFELELRTALMTCAEDELADYEVPDGVIVQALGPDAEREQIDGLLRALAIAFEEAFDPSTSESAAARLLRRTAVIAYCGEQIAGGGMCLDPLERVVELVGIGVMPDFRERGIGAAITGELARISFESGVETAFLTPGSEETARVYERAGFRRTDEMLHLATRA
jgi:N-acetylglutamate synthase-like GNAT family acetyltransferase